MGRTRKAEWDELPGRTEDPPPSGFPLLRTNLRRDEKLAKFQRGMVAACQVAESVQLSNHFCYTFEHEVSLETVKRVTEVKFNNNVVATRAFHEASNSLHRRLVSTGNSDADLSRTKIARKEFGCMCTCTFGGQPPPRLANNDRQNPA